MKVTIGAIPIQTTLPIITIDDVLFSRSAGEIIYALQLVGNLNPTPSLWPAPSNTPAGAEQERQRHEWSQKLEVHFQNMRRRARSHCPPALLPQFEDQLCEVEANVRAAVTGRISLFVDLSYHMRLVEDFQRRWVPYIDPPPPRPPRVQCKEEDRSVWLDGRCIARELDRKQYGFVRAVASAYPDPITWNVISETEKGCLGGNQTRLRESLPPAIKNILESTPKGYGFRLPEEMSAPV